MAQVYKVCLRAPVQDGGKVYPAGIIGRPVLQTGRWTWLVEFKYPDFAYPCRSKRVYAEVSSKDFDLIDETPQKAQ